MFQPSLKGAYEMTATQRGSSFEKIARPVLGTYAGGFFVAMFYWEAVLFSQMGFLAWMWNGSLTAVGRATLWPIHLLRWLF